MKYRVSLVSPPDRERLAAEVLVDGEQLAEISYDTDTPMLELYPRSDGQYWQPDCDEALTALSEAREWLLDRLGPRSEVRSSSHEAGVKSRAMTNEGHPNWKLLLRYGRLKTPYEHFTVLADVEVIEADVNIGSQVGPAWMSMKVWASSAHE